MTSAHHVELKKRLYAAMMAVDPELIRGSQVEIATHINFLADTMCVQLRRAVWARHLGDQIVRNPANWWQAFKDRFFPPWALRRWPVLHATVVVDAFHEYPGIAIEGREPLLRYAVKHDAATEEAPR